MAKPKPFGRPTKYKPEYCQMLIDHMAKGFSFEIFGSTIDVDRATIFRWCDQHEAFRDAKRIAFDKCQSFWEAQGLKGLFNESSKDSDGSTYSRSINSAVWIFNMKNRFKWKDMQEIDQKTTMEIKAPEIIEACNRTTSALDKFTPKG